MGVLTFLAVGDVPTARVKAPLRTGAVSMRLGSGLLRGKLIAILYPTASHEYMKNVGMHPA